MAWNRSRTKLGWGLFFCSALAASGCKSGGVCGGNDLLLEISGDHGHAQRISARALERGAGAYRLEGGSHEHVIRLREAMLAELKSGASVEARSSSGNGHVHGLRLRCAR